MARSGYEVACEYGVSLEDLRGDEKTTDARLKQARAAYAEGLADGTVEDPVQASTLTDEP